MADWWDILTPSLHWAEIVARGTATYLGLTVLLRLLGRRETGGLSLTDLLVVLLTVDAASIGMTGDADSIGDSVLLVLTVLAWSVVLDVVSFRWPVVGHLFKSEPRVLVRDGRVDRRSMRRELMTAEELQSQLRLHGVEDLASVRRAVIEPNGMISIVLAEPSESSEAPDPPPEL